MCVPGAFKRFTRVARECLDELQKSTDHSKEDKSEESDAEHGPDADLEAGNCDELHVVKSHEPTVNLGVETEGADVAEDKTKGTSSGSNESVDKHKCDKCDYASVRKSAVTRNMKTCKGETGKKAPPKRRRPAANALRGRRSLEEAFDRGNRDAPSGNAEGDSLDKRARLS